MLTRERRVVIDKYRGGSISIIQHRWILKDKTQSAPRNIVESLEIVVGGDEESDYLYINLEGPGIASYSTRRLEVNSGSKKHFIAEARKISECLDIEIIGE
jgi:hypothetical protein